MLFLNDFNHKKFDNPVNNHPFTTQLRAPMKCIRFKTRFKDKKIMFDKHITVEAANKVVNFAAINRGTIVEMGVILEVT